MEILTFIYLPKGTHLTGSIDEFHLDLSGGGPPNFLPDFVNRKRGKSVFSECEVQRNKSFRAANY